MVLILTALLAMPTTAAPDDKAQLVMPGIYNDFELPVSAEGAFDAICSDDDRFDSWKRVQVTYEPTELEGVRTEVKGCAFPVILTRGLKRPYGRLPSADPIATEGDSSRWRWKGGEVRVAPVPTKKGANIVLTYRGRSQVLAETDLGKGETYGTRGFEVLWVGDLDGDGRVDLVLSIEGHGTSTEVLLSSRAKRGQLVGLWAAAHVGGC